MEQIWGSFNHFWIREGILILRLQALLIVIYSKKCILGYYQYAIIHTQLEQNV